MKTGRAILSGALNWFLVLSLFGVLESIPAIRQSLFLQSLVAVLFIIPFALLSVGFYYRSGARTSGLLVAFVMVATALLLDVFITVPLVEQPLHGTTHLQFFTNPLLWGIVAEVIVATWLYYRLRIAQV